MFGAEFTACRQAVELLRGLRYKLRMFRVPIDGATCMYCDNEAVYKNIAYPTSVLKKKMHSISYHFCREAVAVGIVQIWISFTVVTNLALSASGVGMESCPDSPEERIVFTSYFVYYFL